MKMSGYEWVIETEVIRHVQELRTWPSLLGYMADQLICWWEQKESSGERQSGWYACSLWAGRASGIFVQPRFMVHRPPHA